MKYIDPAYFLTASKLAWQTALKKIQVKLVLLTDIDMLLMVETGIKGTICHAIIHHYEKGNEYMKYYDKNKEPCYLKSWKVNSLYG